MTAKLCAAVAIVGALTTLLLIGCDPDDAQIRTNYAGSSLPTENWDWAGEKWDGDNAAYKKIKEEINTSIVGGYRLGTIVESNRVKAVASPKNSQAVFAWAYAVQKYTQSHPNMPMGGMMLSRVREAMDRPPSPHSYDYDRLRFLLAHERSGIQVLGERLLKQDPSDDEVKSQLIYAYIDSFGSSLLVSEGAAAKYRARALYLSADLIKSNPKSPSYRATLGSIHYTYFLRHFQDKRYNRTEALNALAAWKDFQKIAKPEDDFYTDSYTMTNTINEYLKTGIVK